MNQLVALADGGDKLTLQPNSWASANKAIKEKQLVAKLGKKEKEKKSMKGVKNAKTTHNMKKVMKAKR